MNFVPTNNKLFRKGETTHHMASALLNSGIGSQYDPHRVTAEPSGSVRACDGQSEGLTLGYAR